MSHQKPPEVSGIHPQLPQVCDPLFSPSLPRTFEHSYRIINEIPKEPPHTGEESVMKSESYLILSYHIYLILHNQHYTKANQHSTWFTGTRLMLPRGLTGRFGPEPFRPRVIFGPGSFRPGSFRPESFRPWVVSANFCGSFRPDIFQT